MGVSLAYSSTLRTTTCIECGCEFAMPDCLYNQYRKNHKDFSCPQGHLQHFNAESDAERLQKELDKQKERTRWAEEETKKVTKKLKKVEKRVSKGVCPCCNRTFIDLQRHMACKHKEYVEGDKK